jgi:magnesium chelatase family protein
VLATVNSSAVVGVEAIPVRVEVDLARGLPAMAVVGLPESSVREGRERVSAALLNSGFRVPHRRITVNLAPADLRKDGSAFDLAIALGVLAASRFLPAARLAGRCFIGELGLDGELRPVRGVLAIAGQCARDGDDFLIVPEGNAAEAAVHGGVRVLAARSLLQVVEWLQGRGTLVPAPEVAVPIGAAPAEWEPDLADVRGQAAAVRALEVAAAGAHNLLMIGPPGAGKSMLARRLPGILPPLSRAEAMAVTQVWSVAGRLRPGQGLVRQRPFRAPHHTISDAGLVGGGARPRPGEASLAHHGVLFLDELPEFRRHVLEALRQPLEDGMMHIGRARYGVSYPSRFMLVAAMNPCPCGEFGGGTARCVCTPPQVLRYVGRVSGPLLDRIDIHLEVPRVEPGDLAAAPCVASADVRVRVAAARDRQRRRFEHAPGVYANAHMDAAAVRRHCALDARAEALLVSATRRLGFSARGFHRVLRIARTVADLEGCDVLAVAHVAEAIHFRSAERARRSALAGAAAGPAV